MFSDLIIMILIGLGIYALVAAAIFVWQIRAGEAVGSAAIQAGGWIVFVWAEIWSRYQAWEASRNR